jgi:hypothetical protein
VVASQKEILDMKEVLEVLQEVPKTLQTLYIYIYIIYHKLLYIYYLLDFKLADNGSTTSRFSIFPDLRGGIGGALFFGLAIINKQINYKYIDNKQNYLKIITNPIKRGPGL